MAAEDTGTTEGTGTTGTAGAAEQAGRACDPPLETAMATGSDEGEPGDPGPVPYPETSGPDTGERDPDAAVEEAPEVVTAAHDDTVLPPSVLGSAKLSTAADDPLTPRFREPGEG